MSKIPSLGDDDSKNKLRLVQEERPLPATREERVPALERIIALGKVQKIVIEVGKPIRFTRYVEATAADPVPAPEDDIFSEIRNAKVEEFVFEDSLPMGDYLFRAFQFLTMKRLKASIFLVSNLPLLKENLGSGDGWAIAELFGVEVVESEQVPQDVLLLAATAPGEKDIELTLRMLLNPPKRKK